MNTDEHRLREINPSESVSIRGSYHREPFAVDVSVGKMDPIYKAHSCHTKVPHLAIVPSILHYTEPGDVVLDGFCDSGMTGMAAQWCGPVPESCRRDLEVLWEKEGRDRSKWGHRRVVLGDRAPTATFIAANYNLPFDVDEFARAAGHILDEVEGKIRTAGGDRERGIEAFLSQNHGEGWMLPETLCLADYGLGHDERARHPQPVASRLGPRFYDWQLTQSPEESWQECHLHARNHMGKEGISLS